MLRFIDHKKMGRSQLGWLDSHFHFSFAEYYNPSNVQFGVLRVINDDLVEPHTGFGAHPHKNMEIITYVVDGKLTHADSMKNQRTLSRGHVQYMSAGTGVTHSEYNNGDETLRLLQIWILPDKNGYLPNYGDHLYPWEDRENKWLHIVAGTSSNAPDVPIHINQDFNIFAASIDAGKSLSLPENPGRQAYLVLIEGKADIEGHALVARDALEIVEQGIRIDAQENAHVLVLEMPKSQQYII